MIDKLIKLFNKKNKLPNLNRIYSVDYFLDKIHQQNFIENGYVVIKNSVENEKNAGWVYNMELISFLFFYILVD